MKELNLTDKTGTQLFNMDVLKKGKTHYCIMIPKGKDAPVLASKKETIKAVSQSVLDGFERVGSFNEFNRLLVM